MTAKPKTRTAAEHERTLADLQERARTNARRRAEIGEERGRETVAAGEGAPGALDRLRALAAEDRQLQDEATNLAAAIGHAEAQLSEAREREAAESRAQAHARAEEIVAEIVAADREIDEGLARLAGMLKERDARLDALQRLEPKMLLAAARGVEVVRAILAAVGASGRMALADFDAQTLKVPALDAPWDGFGQPPVGRVWRDGIEVRTTGR